MEHKMLLLVSTGLAESLVHDGGSCLELSLRALPKFSTGKAAGRVDLPADSVALLISCTLLSMQ